MKTLERIPDLGGYHVDPALAKWPMGSIWKSEGERIYKEVRKLKPDLVLEIGAYFGCSTTWILQALEDNGKGLLVSVDKVPSWSKVPERLQDRLLKVVADARNVRFPYEFDLLYEDGNHDYEGTKANLTEFNYRAVIMHDYLHPSEYGQDCARAFRDVHGEPDEVFIEEPSDCGLALKWVK